MRVHWLAGVVVWSQLVGEVPLAEAGEVKALSPAPARPAQRTTATAGRARERAITRLACPRLDRFGPPTACVF
ncbi:MAG: hypothetical protein ACRDWV_10060 [Acidimicrobiales bacterium]